MTPHNVPLTPCEGQHHDTLLSCNFIGLTAQSTGGGAFIYVRLLIVITMLTKCLTLCEHVLAAYMFQHSNLSRSENALYVQLKRYRRLCE